MTNEQLKSICNDVKQDLLKGKADELKSKLKPSDEDNNISDKDLILTLYFDLLESIPNYVYSVLSKVFDTED